MNELFGLIYIYILKFRIFDFISRMIGNILMNLNEISMII